MMGRPTRQQRYNTATGIDVGPGADVMLALVTSPTRYHF